MPKVLFETPYMAFLENAKGTAYIRMDDAVMIMPVTAEGAVIFIQEFSPAYDKPILTLPTGIVEAGEPIEEAANRELQEEVGQKAGRLDYLGEIYMNIKYIEAKHSVFLARDLSESKLQGDEEEGSITIVHVPLEDVEDLITSGRLTDALVIAGLHLARQKLD